MSIIIWISPFKKKTTADILFCNGNRFSSVQAESWKPFSKPRHGCFIYLKYIL